MDRYLKAFKELHKPIKLATKIEKSRDKEELAKDSFYNPSLYDLQQEYSIYTQMLQRGVENKGVFFRLGRIHHFWGDLDTAKEYYKKALKIDPNDGEVHYNLGNIYFKKDNLSKAKREFLIAIEVKPGDVYSLNAMGNTCFRLKEFKSSKKYHKMALEVNPSDVYAMRGLGDISVVQENYKEAFDYYYRALNINPDDNLTLHNIGLAHFFSGRIELADEHYKTCINRDKTFPGFYFGLAFCEHKQGNQKNALKAYKQGLKLIKEVTGYISMAEYDELSDLGLTELKEMKKEILKEEVKEVEDIKLLEEAEKFKQDLVRKKADYVVGFIGVDPISIEVGRGLLALVDPNQGAKLLDRITAVRRHIAIEMGLVVPGVRFRDNLQLKSNGYIIKIKDIEVSAGEVIMDKFLAIGPEEELEKLKGEKCIDPTYGMPAVWISPEEKEKVEKLDLIFDPVNVIATQVTEIIRSYASELLGTQEVMALLENVKRSHPSLIKEIYPEKFSLGEIQGVLENLLKEKVSIRNIVTILETMGKYASVAKHPHIMTEYVRMALSNSICREYQNEDGAITVIKLDREIEELLYEMRDIYFLSPEKLEIINSALGKEIESLIERANQPILLCDYPIRPVVKMLTEKLYPNLAVLSTREIPPKVTIITDTTIKLSSKSKKAIKSLKIGGKNLFSYIEKLQKDKDPRIRCEAVKNLIPLARKNNLDVILEYLDKGLEDKDADVRLESAGVLREILGKYQVN